MESFKGISFTVCKACIRFILYNAKGL